MRLTALVIGSVLFAAPTHAQTEKTDKSDERPKIAAPCQFNGNAFSTGAILCVGMRRSLTCNGGTWTANNEDMPCDRPPLISR
jgi:hypothetical protein